MIIVGWKKGGGNNRFKRQRAEHLHDWEEWEQRWKWLHLAKKATSTDDKAVWHGGHMSHIVCLNDCQPDLILFNHNLQNNIDGAAYTHTHTQHQITRETTHCITTCVRLCACALPRKLQQSSQQYIADNAWQSVHLFSVQKEAGTRKECR